jgi:hypothetical protein
MTDLSLAGYMTATRVASERDGTPLSPVRAVALARTAPPQVLLTGAPVVDEPTIAGQHASDAAMQLCPSPEGSRLG